MSSSIPKSGQPAVSIHFHWHSESNTAANQADESQYVVDLFDRTIATLQDPYRFCRATRMYKPHRQACDRMIDHR